MACSLCRKANFLLINTNENSLLINNECYEFKDLFKDLFQMLSLNNDLNMICESCKDSLVQFFIFKRNINIPQNKFKQMIISQIENYLEQNECRLDKVLVIRKINSITLQLDKEDLDFISPKLEQSEITVNEVRDDADDENNDNKNDNSSENIAYETLIADFLNCTRCGKFEASENELSVHTFLKHSSFGVQLSMEIENSKLFIKNEANTEEFFICFFCSSQCDNADSLLLHLLHHHAPDLLFQINESLPIATHLIDFSIINAYLSFIRECLLNIENQAAIDDECQKYFFETYSEFDNASIVSEKEIAADEIRDDEEEIEPNDDENDYDEEIYDESSIVSVKREMKSDKNEEGEEVDKTWLRQEIQRSKFVVQTETGEKRVIFRCSLCNHSSNSSSGLRYHLLMKHLKNHDNNFQEQRKPFNSSQTEEIFYHTTKSKNFCNECCLKFKDARALQLHEKCHELFSIVAHLSVFPTCNTCNQKFITEELLQRHLIKHDVNESLLNPIAVNPGAVRLQGKSSASNEYVSIGETTEIEYAWKCGHCESKFFSKEEHCNLHILMAHTTSFTCPIDKMEFTGFKSVSLFVHHLRNKHPELFPNLSFTCTFCDLTFTTIYDKLSHMKTCKNKLYECDHCGKKYWKKGDVLNHLKVYVTEEVQFRCSICSKKCLSLSDLKIHNRSHTKIKPYKCSMCKKMFRTLAARASHLESHNTSLVFVCKICKKSFKQRQLYRRHMKKTHESTMPS